MKGLSDMAISGETKIVALLGDPVTHTLSPRMHNAAFEAMGLDYCYVAFPVKREFLREAVASVRALGMAGVNVTVPHKEGVMPFLDRVDEEASFIGAVNTIVNQSNKGRGNLVGYNTDGRGFMQSLVEANIDVQGKNVLIVGTGGASRAVSYYLSEKAGSFSMFDIDTEKAGRLAGDLGVVGRKVTLAESADKLSEVDVIINATPLGLKETDPLPIDLSLLSPSHTVVDLIYRETPLLRAASDKGCATMHGLGMLLWQGVFASELWTGQPPPVDVMREALVSGMA